MGENLEFLWTLLGEFSGGPGPKENNLVRFGLAAMLWAVLLFVAWSRQRQQKLPRERLLVWGFGLALARELFMFSHVAAQFIQGGEIESSLHFTEPLEHALTMAAIVMVAGAFIRYLQDDARLARHYLTAGLSTAVVVFFVTWWWWHTYASANPGARFNQTWGGTIFFVVTGFFAAVAIVLLSRKRGWLSNVVSLALALYVVIGVLRVVNLASARVFAEGICRICNSLHILAIPLFGYVYIREQGIEKEQAEKELAAYRDQLEELVAARTTELMDANDQLQRQMAERRQVEVEVARRNTELAAQNAIAATISQSLDLDRILDTALDTVSVVLEMEAGCIFLLESDGVSLTLATWRGRMAPDEAQEKDQRLCSSAGCAQQAVVEMRPVVVDVDGYSYESRSSFVAGDGLRTLVSTPLVSKGRAVGALSLGSRRPEAIRANQLDLLAGIGRQIGMVVENANLYRQTELWAHDLTLLHQVSVFLSSTLDPGEIYEHVTEQSVKLTGCHAAAVFRWDAGRQTAIGVTGYSLDGIKIEALRLSLAEGPFLPELVTERNSVPVVDGRTDPRVPDSWREIFKVQGMLCVPIWGTEGPLALLFLIDRARPRNWQPGEIQLVESFVNRAALALENAYLHMQLQWAAALEERQRIAAEMHDGLAQTLSYLALKSTHASELLEAGLVDETLEQHADIQDAIVRATKEVRRSIASLQESPPPRRPLQEWLAEIAAEYGAMADPPVRLESSVEELVYLESGQLEQVIRVVQEAMLNASRHADARQIVLRLEQEGDDCLLTIEDDGMGFDPDAPRVGGGEHFGLSIMRARASRIGGQLCIKSAPGMGTRVSLGWSPGDGEPGHGFAAGAPPVGEYWYTEAQARE